MFLFSGFRLFRVEMVVYQGGFAASYGFTKFLNISFFYPFETLHGL